MDFLVAVVHANTKLSIPLGTDSQLKVTAVAATILKSTWEARNDLVFDNIQVDLARVGLLPENYLKL